METITQKPRYEYHHADQTLMFDSIEYEVGTKMTDYEVMTDNMNTAVNGRTPEKVTLKGRFLKNDLENISDYFRTHTGFVLSNCVVNDKMYGSMVILQGKASLGENESTGEMVMVLREVIRD